MIINLLDRSKLTKSSKFQIFQLIFQHIPPTLIFIYIYIQVSQVSPTRPERAEALSPGHRPGLFGAVTCRPVRAKALKLQAIYKAVALTGRIADCHYTQGDALG